MNLVLQDLLVNLEIEVNLVNKVLQDQQGHQVHGVVLDQEVKVDHKEKQARKEALDQLDHWDQVVQEEKEENKAHQDLQEKEDHLEIWDLQAHVVNQDYQDQQDH